MLRLMRAGQGQRGGHRPEPRAGPREASVLAGSPDLAPPSGAAGAACALQRAVMAHLDLHSYLAKIS